MLILRVERSHLYIMYSATEFLIVVSRMLPWLLLQAANHAIISRL